MAGNRRPRTEKKPVTRRLNAQVREESLRRLMVHVVMMGQNPGDIISDLIDAHLREWKVQKNSPARVMSTESASPDDQASESEREAA